MKFLGSKEFTFINSNSYYNSEHGGFFCYFLAIVLWRFSRLPTKQRLKKLVALKMSWILLDTLFCKVDLILQESFALRGRDY